MFALGSEWSLPHRLNGRYENYLELLLIQQWTVQDLKGNLHSHYRISLNRIKLC